MGQQPDLSTCSLQPSKDPGGRLGSPLNHLLLRSAEKFPPHPGGGELRVLLFYG